MSDFEKKQQEQTQETRVMPQVSVGENELGSRRRRRAAKQEPAANEAAFPENDGIGREQPAAPGQETTMQPAAPVRRPAEEPTDGTTVQPAVKAPEHKDSASFGSRVTTREPLRREPPSQGIPRPEALNRASRAQQTAGADASDRPLYRQPVNAPGYTPTKPVSAPPRRTPAYTEYVDDEPEKPRGNVLFIAVAVVLVLAMLVLGVMLIPDDADGVLGAVKGSVNGMIQSVRGDNGPQATEVPPSALDFYAALTQVNTGETVNFNLTTTKNATAVRLVDMDGRELTTQNTQVDNTENLIWIIKLVPTEAYDGEIWAQVASGDTWVDTGMKIELEVVATAMPTVDVSAGEAATQVPVFTEAPTEVPDVLPVDGETPDALVTEEVLDGESGPMETLSPEQPISTEYVFDGPTLAPSSTPTVPMDAEVTPVPDSLPVMAPVDSATEAPAAAQATAEPAVGQPLQVTADASADPSLIANHKIYDGSKVLTSYLRDQEDMVNMPAGSEYTRLPYGVLTFRGNAFRQNAAEGVVDAANELSVLWKVNASSVKGSGSTTYYGINYTGQPAIIKWSTEVRGISNMKDEAKNTKGLTEVIVAGDDGRIYFLNLKDGTATRDVINVGYPMRGTPSIHPYGFPLMAVGQYARKMASKTGDIGLRIYSLVDQKQVHMLDGLDKSFTRPYYGVGSFETSALIDPVSDTMVTAGTNGMLYLTKLNTRFEYNATTGEGGISVSPSSIVLTSKAAKQEDKTTAEESSIAMYQNYVFYADMKGILRCVDTNTLETLWAVDTGDAVEAAVALDMDSDGTLWLYTANTLQNRSKGNAQIRRFNAATGAQDWVLEVPVVKQKKTIAGFRASPVIGQNDLSDYVYYTVSHVTKAGGKALGLSGALNGALLCVEKATGEVVWTQDLGAYSYSSPVAVYDEEGRGWIVQGASNGKLTLLDGRTGEVLHTLKLDGAVNASPAVYKNTLVVGTTGKGKSAIYGIELK